jgi:hypothetical protein
MATTAAWVDGGFLGQVLAKPSEPRRNLVWKNFWYGARRRRVIKAFPHRFEISRPVHYMRPEVCHALKDLVPFEPEEVRQFEPEPKKSSRKK